METAAWPALKANHFHCGAIRFGGVGGNRGPGEHCAALVQDLHTRGRRALQQERIRSVSSVACVLPEPCIVLQAVGKNRHGKGTLRTTVTTNPYQS